MRHQQAQGHGVDGLKRPASGAYMQCLTPFAIIQLLQLPRGAGLSWLGRTEGELPPPEYSPVTPSLLAAPDCCLIQKLTIL